MKTSEQIIHYLKTHKQATADEISKHLFVTPTAIRYHLKNLKDAGIIKSVNKVKTGKRGRPQITYTLAKYPQKFEYLCRAMLKFIYQTPNEMDKSTQDRLVLAFIPENLIETGEFTQKSQSPTLLLKEAVDFLTQRGYNAKWEAQHTGPILTLHTCPYQPLVDEFPQLCDFDSQLIEKLTQHKVESFSKFTYVNNRQYPCRFLLSRKP